MHSPLIVRLVFLIQQVYPKWSLQLQNHEEWHHHSSTARHHPMTTHRVETPRGLPLVLLPLVWAGGHENVAEESCQTLQPKCCVLGCLHIQKIHIHLTLRNLNSWKKQISHWCKSTIGLAMQGVEFSENMKMKKERQLIHCLMISILKTMSHQQRLSNQYQPSLMEYQRSPIAVSHLHHKDFEQTIIKILLLIVMIMTQRVVMKVTVIAILQQQQHDL
mmetsp:Transcript_1746/g.2438  ORF Transcript_1746/g.2438 Transcript_1746/m.2438 type:complete len:218 (-) Transcript_1746:65-718(-)